MNIEKLNKIVATAIEDNSADLNRFKRDIAAGVSTSIAARNLHEVFTNEIVLEWLTTFSTILNDYSPTTVDQAAKKDVLLNRVRHSIERCTDSLLTEQPWNRNSTCPISNLHGKSTARACQIILKVATKLLAALEAA